MPISPRVKTPRRASLLVSFALFAAAAIPAPARAFPFRNGLCTIYSVSPTSGRLNPIAQCYLPPGAPSRAACDCELPQRARLGSKSPPRPPDPLGLPNPLGFFDAPPP